VPAAISFQGSVLAIHIAAVVVGFGVLFAYPFLYAVIGRQDPRALPAMHRAELALSQRLVGPALAVVVLAGIYLASDEHQWSRFYVQWGLGMAVFLGALSGAFFVPNERRIAEVAHRDVAAAGDGPVSMSPEYGRLASRLAVVGGVVDLLLLLTIYFMANHVGAPGP
jgi:hypothetical protein